MSRYDPVPAVHKDGGVETKGSNAVGDRADLASLTIAMGLTVG